MFVGLFLNWIVNFFLFKLKGYFLYFTPIVHSMLKRRIHFRLVLIVFPICDNYSYRSWIELSFPDRGYVHFRLHNCKRHKTFKKLKKTMYFYSNKIRFIGIILFSFLYRPISVDSMRSVFLFHILNDRNNE
jgi:hypothetical protein